MLLYNDTKAINFGQKYNPELVEVHSVCLNDIKLLSHLKENINSKTAVVLGVGGTDLYEIENAIEVLGTDNVVLMHGFQNYPTKYEDINFSKIRKIMELYPSFKHGYADHTAWNHEQNILITMFGAALGVEYIEKHVTTTTGEGRTDWQAAISLAHFIEIQNKLEILSVANGNGLLKLNDGESTYSTFGAMKKAAIINRDILAGHEFSDDDFSFKRTGQSSDLSQLDVLAKKGKRIKTNLKKGHCLLIEDFE